MDMFLYLFSSHLDYSYWGEWYDYGYCSVTCGEGKQEFSRLCESDYGCYNSCPDTGEYEIGSYDSYFYQLKTDPCYESCTTTPPPTIIDTNTPIVVDTTNEGILYIKMIHL